MSTITPRPSSGAGRGPSGAGGPSSILAPTIDPLRLFRKYWVVLVVALFFGTVLGLGAHVALRATYPIYRAMVIFECKSPQLSPGETPRVDEDELVRFMTTQTAIMTSERVLQRATRDNQARFQQNAPTWSARFTRGGQFAWQDAASELRDTVKARVVPGTNLVTLSLGWKIDREVAALVGLVREAYLLDLQTAGSQASSDQVRTLNRAISDLDNALREDQARRTKLLDDNRVDAIDTKLSEARMAIDLINKQLIETRYQLDALRVQIAEREQDRLSQAGTDHYPDSLRAQIETNRTILVLRSQLNDQESGLLAMKQAGFGPRHRDRQQLEASIAATKQKLAMEQERQLREAFDAMLDGMRLTRAQWEAQERELITRLTEYQDRLITLTNVETQIQDIQDRMKVNLATKATYEARLKELEVVRRLADADRVLVLQMEQVPTEVAFPKWYFLTPAGIVLVVGLVTGMILLREILDQRVKGPSDIALIPRTRVVSIVPHAAETPNGKTPIETVFRDDPRGVLAESFRHTRSVLLQRMGQAGHKSLLVVAASPGSGATTIVANLGMAFASADTRVLVIDANFRRPRLHTIFKVAEGPGLGDVLKGDVDLARALQTGGIEGLGVLTAGTPSIRRAESLASEKMGAILAQATSQFDYVILDVAPAVVSGDAAALANRCDATVLIARAYNEKRGLIARLRGELSEQRGEFLGVMVNAVRSSAGGYLRRNIIATHDYQATDKS